MIVTSTNDIKDHKITEYIGLVNANIVVGGNFITEFFASFSDVLGGQSISYQKTLDEIYNKALNELIAKAQKNKADAIVGVHFDFGDISGKGMSMFMVTAYGTAVKIISVKEENEKKDRYEVYQRLYNLSQFRKADIITSEQYEAERNNLLLSYEDEIEEELRIIKSDNDQKETIKQELVLKQRQEENRRKEREILIEQLKKDEEEAIKKEQEKQNSVYYWPLG